jgi:hypothetical protein
MPAFMSCDMLSEGGCGSDSFLKLSLYIPQFRDYHRRNVSPVSPLQISIKRGSTAIAKPSVEVDPCVAMIASGVCERVL